MQRRAKKYASIAASHDFSAWNMGATIQYSGSRKDIDINAPYGSITLPSYTLVNLTASHRISKQFKLSLRADNVLNKDYMLAHGYNTLGRSLFVGISYQQ